MNETIRYPFLSLQDVNSPYFDELIDAVTRVIKSGRYIGGNEVNAFEDKLSEMVGTEYAIGVSNGLDALRLILRSYIELGYMRPNDEILVAGNTYIASVLAISDAGLRPVLVDADISTMNIDTRLIESSITPRTRGIMTVHLYGRVAWDETIKELSRQYGLKIIEDCAQAIGARSLTPGLRGSTHVGNLGDAGAFSFYPTKNIGALGDGGAVTTNDMELAQTIRAMANYGSDFRYHNIYRGYNCRLDPIQAAMLNVKLPHTNEENADRFARAMTYTRNISHKDMILPMHSKELIDHVWHQYVIRITGGKRDIMKHRLEQLGVETDIHYPTPPHMQPCYTNLSHTPLPVTELLASEVLSLPIGGGTTIKDASEIAEIINSIEL